MIQLDEVGTLYEALPPPAPGQVNTTQPEALPGWHLNATAPVPGWDAWRVYPATPRRVFAGVATVHYSFDSQAQYTTARADLAPTALTQQAPAVPQTVTMRQARLALLGVGKLATVEAALASLPEPQQTAARIEWEYSSEVHRNKELVQALAPALGLTDTQLDSLFTAADQL